MLTRLKIAYQKGYLRSTSKVYQRCQIGLPTDIQGRSQTLYTTPCNGVVSHWLKLGVFRFLPTTHTTTITKQMHPRFSRTVQCLRIFIFTLRQQYMQVTYAPDELWLCWLQEKPEDPQFEPHARIKIMQFLWSSLFICGSNWKVEVQLKSNLG